MVQQGEIGLCGENGVKKVSGGGDLDSCQDLRQDLTKGRKKHSESWGQRPKEETQRKGARRTETQREQNRDPEKGRQRPRERKG